MSDKKDDQSKLTKEQKVELIKRFAKAVGKNVSDNLITSQKKSYFGSSTKFSAENVNKYLENPQNYSEQLRDLSIVLYTVSPLYAQVVNYFPSISRYIPIIIPNIDKFSNASGNITNEAKMKKEYLKVCNYVDNMNLEHEFDKICFTCNLEDVFYGYCIEDSDSFFFLQLDPEYCQISTISDGCFNFLFDFSYFDKMTNIKYIETDLLSTYPAEFQKKYKIYKNKGNDYKWQELDPRYTICIKWTDLPFIFPPWANIYGDLADIQDYKDNEKASSEASNYKFIGMELPLLDKNEKVDDFAVSTDIALSFYEALIDSLPGGIGAFLSATPFKAIDFGSNASAESTKIANAEASLFLNTGLSPVNFGRVTNSTGLTASNLVDSGKLYNFYVKLERWLNRKLKLEFGGKFKVQLIQATTFTEKDVIDRYIKTAQFGVPVKLQVAAMMGATQLNERGLSALESLLNLNETWTPLNSSFINPGQSAGGTSESSSSSETSDGRGRPLKSEEDTSQADTEDNNNEEDGDV